MLTIDDILAQHRSARKRPSEEELRRLPDRRALVYARPSSPHQVQESRESMREIGALVDLARADGYRTGIERAEVDAWVEDIRTGAVEPGVREDGGLMVVTLDLGISGTLGHERRRGLALVKELLERQELGAVYLPEVSRLSRDQHFIEPFVLLRLMKEGACKVRTPDGVLSPQIPRDWETLKDEFDDARQELRMLARRLHRKRRQRAERGEWSGEPVPAGFILPVVERRADGRYIFGKYEPYPPHAQMVVACLETLVRHRSFVEAARALRGRYFPLFPPELDYMEKRSGLHYCMKTPGGYRITPNVIRTLAADPRMIGVWTWGDTDPIPGNHPPAVPEDLWLQAHEIATSTAKPRGRAARSEPLDWTGLLYRCSTVTGDMRAGFEAERERVQS
jgi:DNA invertase Pin-like site-specific DNA recombinase